MSKPNNCCRCRMASFQRKTMYQELDLLTMNKIGNPCKYMYKFQPIKIEIMREKKLKIEEENNDETNFSLNSKIPNSNKPSEDT